VLAGTSERGCCRVCGAPWERVVVAEAPDGRRAEVRGGKAYDENGEPLMGDNMFDPGVRGSFNSGGQTLKRETAGWRPTCDHQATPIPCTVMDPFLGSGTTALVARHHGRRAIGIELNQTYAELAARRNQQMTLYTEVMV
jgi:DNA methylase